MKQFKLSAATALVIGALSCGWAVASEPDAAQLKTKYTPVGAERAGNSDGSIPAWTGGYTTALATDAKAGDRRSDPFSADKPTLTITAENMDKYGDKLNDGTKALLKKYKTFQVNVYPTRRTALAPQWYYDNTEKNATRSKVASGGMGLDPAGAGGLPFPFPKTGDELRWNTTLHWRGESSIARQKIWTVTPQGQQVLASDTENHEQFMWNAGPNSPEKFDGAVTTYYMQNVNGPAFRAGEAMLVHHPIDFSKSASQVWSYLAGQRRVRRAPSVGYDTPDFVASGVNFFDEAQAPVSNPDRFDWKIVGKQEMYVPYNNNGMFSVKDEAAMGTNHVKPEVVRWELHRVWVLEASRKAGQRHAVAKRRFYIDEDSWATVLQDGWDDQGKLWRTVQLFGFAAPDVPAYVGGTCWDAFYNLQTGQYVYRCGMGDALPQYQIVKPRNGNFFSPDSLAARGVR